MNTYISKIHQHSKYKSKPGVIGRFCDGKCKKKKTLDNWVYSNWEGLFLGDMSKRSLLKIRVAERQSLSVSDACESPLS